MVISNTMREHQSPTKGRETIMAHHRSGAALIMAIVILAALLMLGLPFLFSQSASLTGTRSFAHSQMAQTGRSTAEDLGIGAANYIFNRNFLPGSVGESTDMNNIPGGVTLPTDPRRRTLDLSPTEHAFNPAEPRNAALMGVSLEDESGKLDPNHMDVKAWTLLLAKVNIGDWDDGSGTNMDTDSYGQLADALANVRFDESVCPTGHITHIEQLLEAKPLPNGVRHPLTRAELEQIRPFLTLASLGQGREGLIDLGTMIRLPSAPGESKNNNMLDSTPPSGLLAYPTTPSLFAAGSVVVSKHPTEALNPIQIQRGLKYHYGMSSSTDLKTIRSAMSHSPDWEEAVGLEIPAPVNLIESSAVVREVLWRVNQQPTPQDLFALLQTQADLKDVFGQPIMGLHLVNPLGVFDDTDIDSKITVMQSEIEDSDSGITRNNRPDGTLTSTATMIRIAGVGLDRVPDNGFARIDSVNKVSGAPQKEFVSYLGFGYIENNVPIIGPVTRGLNFPGSSGALRHPAGSQLTFIAPRELPPLALTSQGMVTIESGSSVADAAGRQGAQQFRRVVAQAVPQESLLEKRWEKQTQLHSLLVQRQGSLMSSFPVGHQRLVKELPSNNAATTARFQDDNIGVRPATLRTHLSSSHLSYDWFVRFGVTGTNPNDADFLDYHQTDGRQGRPTAGGGPPAHLSPEGFPLQGPLAYPLFTGPSTIEQNTTEGFLTYTVTDDASSLLNGRQLGMWIKPLETFTGVVTLLDLRSPVSHAGKRWAAGINAADGRQNVETNGDNFYQNRVTLAYEDTTKQLVLTIANNATEHLVDHGMITQSEQYTFPKTLPKVPPTTDPDKPFVDPRCLGTETAGILPPNGITLRPLAPKRPFNLVQHRYQLDKADGLKVDQWYFVQMSLDGNSPGRVAIIVNGIVGKDVTRASAAGTTLTMNQIGDHITLPSLVLRTALPATPNVRNGGASTILFKPKITVDAYAVDPITQQVVTGAAAVAALLPTRGVIRIGNEFISYDDLQGVNLLHCMRGRRQDSDTLQSASNAFAWIHIEEHLVGDQILAGGIRFNPGSQGHLWQGQCKLAHDFPNGDPTKFFTVWGELALPTTIDPLNGRPTLLASDLSGIIKVQNGRFTTSPAEWPPRGYAKIFNPVNAEEEIIYYDNGGMTPTTQLLGVIRGQLGTTAKDFIYPNPPTKTDIPTITLVSFEVVTNPIGSFPDYIASTPADPNPPQERRLVQFMDTVTSRIEWIGYDRLATTNGAYFFIDTNWEFGFDPTTRSRGSRARQRTAFAATDIPNGNAIPFRHDRTTILPVQTSLDTAYVLVTGDVLTITPKALSAPGSQRPVCVRYAATDGFHVTPGLTTPDYNSWDTVNRCFAFTEKLDQKWEDGTFELMNYPGWCGDDLTRQGPPNPPPPTDSHILPHFTMPLAGAFAMNGASVYFGGDDTVNAFPMRPAVAPKMMVIDGLFSGYQPNGYSSSSGGQTVVESFGAAENGPFSLVFDPKTDQKLMPWLDAAPLPATVFICTTNHPFSDDLGLVLIGGEVFAYEGRRPPNGRPSIRLVGRGLLGSKPIIHRGPEAVLVLPIGPVGRLVEKLDLSATSEQQLFISTKGVKYPSSISRGYETLNAPVMLLSSSDGAQMELITATNRCVAPWHRGMYNTEPQKNWPGSYTNDGNPKIDTLVIGWWPRYPSGLPNQQAQLWSSLSNDKRSAMLRCRMYAWMGFPIRFHDTWMQGGAGLLNIDLIDDGVGTFNVLATALDQGFDWNESLANSVTLNAGVNGQDASAIFSRFQNKSVDGIEARVRWEYRLPPANSSQGGSGPTGNAAVTFLNRVATAGNTAPMIGKVKLRAHAPVKILQVEEAR
jgi:hypothetical protein